MLKNFIFSFKKSNVLSKIAKNEESKIDFKKIIDYTVDKNKTREKLLHELFNLLQKDKFTLQLLKVNQRDFTDLRKIIENLTLNGAGQIINGHYVPVSSIAFVDTLKVLFNYWNGESFTVDDFDNYNSNLYVADKMLSSF